jgi:hypothetical protein
MTDHDMTTRKSWHSNLLLIVVAAVLLPPMAAQAQRAPRAPTFIAVAESFPDVEARSILLRERGRDIVILKEAEATTDALAMALLLLERIRSRYPSPEHGQFIPITGHVVTRRPTGAYLRRLEATLEKLAAAPSTTVGNFGPGRWVRYRER